MAVHAQGATDDQNVLCHPQKGLPTLALELLFHIVSHMRCPVIPRYDEYPMGNEERERRECLRALCQLCRSLRRTLLPVLWERLEACTIRSPTRTIIPGLISRAMSRLLEQEVIGQLKLILDLTPAPYASYVRVINVTIETRYSPSALSKLARAMTLMPNLHTIQINCERSMHGRSTKTDPFAKAFKKRVYPSVRRASLPHQAKSILASFPELVEVYANQLVRDPQFREFLPAIALHCPKIECFGYWHWHETDISMVVDSQIFPTLRRLECHLNETLESTAVVRRLLDLRNLKSLEKFTLIFTHALYYHRDCEQVPESLAIDVARKVFAESSSSKKCFVLHYYGQTRVETFGIA